MTKSALDYDFRIGLDDIEEDEPVKSKKQQRAEKKRQIENLKRYEWFFGKIGAISLKCIGELLVWSGGKTKTGSKKLDDYVSKIKPKKKSPRKKEAKA